MEIIQLALRLLQFFWTLLILALVGNMIADASGGNPSIVNYDMFTAVFGMLSLCFLIPAAFKPEISGHPLVLVALDGLNVLFFFCGAVAMAAELKVHSCSNQSYLKSNSITSGSANKEKRCREAQAVTAFLWFGFAAWVASAVMSGLSGMGGGTISTRSRGSLRK